jgi:hypothetical protein
MKAEKVTPLRVEKAVAFPLLCGADVMKQAKHAAMGRERSLVGFSLTFY